MWRRRTAFVRQALVAFDTLVSAGAFMAALVLRDQLARVHESSGVVAELFRSMMLRIGGVPPAIFARDYGWLMLGLVPLWAVSLHYTRAGETKGTYRAAAGRYARAVLLGLGLFILVAFLFKLQFVARSFVVMFAGLQWISLLVGRVAVMQVLGVLRRRSADRHRVIIVGSGAAAVEFAASLLAHSPFVIEVLGFVSVPGEQGAPEARPHLGFVGSLDALLDRLPVDEVVFAVPERSAESFREAISACDERGVDVLLTLPPEVPRSATMEIAQVSGFNLPMLGLRRTPKGELRLAVKRWMDVALGLVGLIGAAPIMLSVAIAIRVDSRGPILFKQVRAGRNGRKFVMYKFRSMVVDAEAKKAALMGSNELDGPVFKIRRDPRITAMGRFIRKTSIDELPQLFNILKGDMSVVGPRPPLPSEVEQYEPWQRRRLSVRPGLTGLWQVSGRNQVDFDEWMQLDLQYIDNWSLWLDLKIILQTIPAVLLRKGAS